MQAGRRVNWQPNSSRDAGKGSGEGAEAMVGFVTARLTPLTESDPKDRALLGLAAAGADRQRAVYILTLGTLPALRQQVHAWPTSPHLPLKTGHTVLFREQLYRVHGCSRDRPVRLVGPGLCPSRQVAIC